MKSIKKSISKVSEQDFSETENDYYISDEDEMSYDSASNESSQESEMEEDLDSEDDSDEVPVEMNVSESRDKIKKLMESDIERLKQKNKMDKEKRSKKPKTDDFKDDYCISQIEEKMVNFLDDGRALIIDDMSDLEEESDNEEIKPESEDNSDLESQTEEDIDDMVSDNSDKVSTKSQQKVDVMSTKTILIKQKMEPKKFEKAKKRREEKILSKFDLVAKYAGKPVKQLSAAEKSKLRKLRKEKPYC